MAQLNSYAEALNEYLYFCPNASFMLFRRDFKRKGGPPDLKVEDAQYYLAVVVLVEVAPGVNMAEVAGYFVRVVGTGPARRCRRVA